VRLTCSSPVQSFGACGTNSSLGTKGSICCFG
jgi:hypothetical protein